MISPGDEVPDLPCYAANNSAQTLHALGCGEHLVLYLRADGIADAIIDEVASWPLPTWPRTTFVTVDYESASHGYLRALTIEDLSFRIGRTLGPTAFGLRAIVVNPDRVITSVIDSNDPVSLRAMVCAALQASAGEPARPEVAVVLSSPMVVALCDRTTMLLSPLVERVEPDTVKTISTPTVIRVRLAVAWGVSEVLERLVGVGYDYLGTLGDPSLHTLRSPLDEPPHVLLLATPLCPL
jgi:hypothetical protein